MHSYFSDTDKTKPRETQQVVHLKQNGHQLQNRASSNFGSQEVIECPAYANVSNL